MEPNSDPATIASAGLSQAGAVAAVVGGLSAQEITMYGGLFIGVISLFYNMWHTTQLRKIARDRAESIKRIKEDK